MAVLKRVNRNSLSAFSTTANCKLAHLTSLPQGHESAQSQWSSSLSTRRLRRTMTAVLPSTWSRHIMIRYAVFTIAFWRRRSSKGLRSMQVIGRLCARTKEMQTSSEERASCFVPTTGYSCMHSLCLASKDWDGSLLSNSYRRRWWLVRKWIKLNRKDRCSWSPKSFSGWKSTNSSRSREKCS